MTAKVIDGVKLAASLREQVAERAAVLARQGVKPGLAVVLVGSDAASQVYVRKHSMPITASTAYWFSCLCRSILIRIA